MSRKPRRRPAVALASAACWLFACAAATPPSPARSPAMTAFTVDLGNPDQHVRIDSYVVPDAARREFEEAMRRNLAFIETLPGFLGHAVFEKEGGPTSFNLATMAAWESKAAHDRAVEEVRAYYRRIGFDPPAAMARWGVRAEQGVFRPAKVAP